MRSWRIATACSATSTVRIANPKRSAQAYRSLTTTINPSGIAADSACFRTKSIRRRSCWSSLLEQHNRATTQRYSTLRSRSETRGAGCITASGVRLLFTQRFDQLPLEPAEGFGGRAVVVDLIHRRVARLSRLLDQSHIDQIVDMPVHCRPVSRGELGDVGHVVIAVRIGQHCKENARLRVIAEDI